MRKEGGYENQTRRGPEWKPVLVPGPVFDSPDDKARHEEALRTTPRRVGEDVCAWLDRVTAAVAGAPVQAQLPYREPGEEG